MPSKNNQGNKGQRKKIVGVGLEPFGLITNLIRASVMAQLEGYIGDRHTNVDSQWNGSNHTLSPY